MSDVMETELQQCLRWLNHLRVGHIIGARDLPFIDCIREEITSACEEEERPPEGE